MRTALTFLFVMFSAFAQNHPASTSPIRSCGPSEQDFDVKLDKTSHAVNQPQPGKALVYVIEVFQVPRKFFSGSPTIRIGLDGSWMGANRGNSYLSFSVTPGEHHLCGYWQSSLLDTSGQHSLAGFFAEADKTYFFRVQTHGEFDSAEPETWSIDLQPIDADEGKYLVASYPLSISHLKKQN